MSTYSNSRDNGDSGIRVAKLTTGRKKAVRSGHEANAIGTGVRLSARPLPLLKGFPFFVIGLAGLMGNGGRLGCSLANGFRRGLADRSGCGDLFWRRGL